MLESRIAGDLSDEAFRGELRRIFRDHFEALPALEDDAAEAVAMMAEREAAGTEIDLFLRCLARTADPISCATDPSYVEGD